MKDKQTLLKQSRYIDALSVMCLTSFIVFCLIAIHSLSNTPQNEDRVIITLLFAVMMYLTAFILDNRSVLFRVLAKLED